jgi:hypothetical protein
MNKQVNLNRSTLNNESNKSILVVSYYYSPCLGVATYRPLSWVNEFVNQGYKVTVITRHWTGKEVTWGDYIKPNRSMRIVVQEENSAEVVYLPVNQKWWVRWPDLKSPLKQFAGRAIYLLNVFTGGFNPELAGYNTFVEEFKSQIKTNKFKYIILTCPPIDLSRLAMVAHKLTDSKVIVDFRDLWNNRLLSNIYRPGFKEIILNLHTILRLKKWLAGIDMCTIASPDFKTHLGKITNAEIFTLYNGFNKKYRDEITKVSDSKFRITIVGTIYPKQDLNIFISGLNQFIAQHEENSILLRLVGLTQFPEIVSRLKSEIFNVEIQSIPKLPQAEAIKYTVNTEVLFYPAWKGMRGIVSTKIFDYISSGNHVIIAPGDDNVIDFLVSSSNSGKSFNSASELSNHLSKLYSSWRSAGKLSTSINEEFVNYFSRENLSKIFFNRIKEL